MQRQNSGWDPTPWLDMLRRRRWLALTLFASVLTFSASFIAFLPNMYTASALVLVEGQQIPEDYVRPTVRMPVQQRLYNISQRALSRSRLERLGNEFHLYEKEKHEQSLEDWIETIRKAISIDVKGSTQTGAVAFSVGFSGTDPQAVMDVTNTLASFYIEENVRMRETQAVGTSNFLQVQLAQVKQTLEAQEQKITDYKKRFLGELPEQLDANLKTLERLQVQLQLLSENLSRAQERRNALTYQINAIQAGGPVVTGPTDASVLRMQELRRQLAELQTRFRDNYPDVQMAKQELATLERQFKTRPRSAGSAGAGGAGAPQMSVLLTPLQAQLKEVEGEARLLSAERASLLRDIAQYQARIENTPKREQELLSLTRDYNSTRELYASLLKRQEEAHLAGNMERQQKGEQLRILDPATYPEKPSGPPRLLLLILACLLSLGAAAAGVLLWEKVLDQSFHHPGELEAFAKAAVLATISDIVTEEDVAQRRRRRFLGVAAFAVSLIALVGASRHLAAHNEQIVIKLGAKTAATASDPRFQFIH